MPVLDSKLRSDLDGVCQKARDLAEAAARSALQKRAVDAAEPFPHFTAEDRDLRNRLRARGRQLGDVRNANKTQSIDQLTQELAYEYWHRMLFARFLADNHLLMHPDGVAVSLAECDELAASEGAANGFVLAARYASKMLPQIFRTDDVLLEIEFPVNDRLPLEKLVNGLPVEAFTADDSLGWVYQFWQTKRKKEVNDSGEKIDGRTLPAVTQLFTEHYMVQFLLHNTIGAWWCARHGIKGPPGGAGVPAGQAPVEMEYLRWRDDGTPAAGTFDGWPKSFKEFTLLDPCCGSGHFLVAAFNLLVPLRMHDEGLPAQEACDAVLRENLFGLELDPRCTQIAAFALAVAAWKYVDSPSPSGRGAGGEGQPLGYRELPPLNIACTGIGPQATEGEWLKLAEQSGKPMSVLSREPILNGLGNLYALFSDAPTLGSLIDPNQLSADLITADYETLQPYLAAALTAEQGDDDAHERAVAAAGMVKAAELLAGEYTLVATNVPYLGRGKQADPLKAYLEKHFKEGKADLATALVLRCLEFCAKDGTAALVTPQNWLYLGPYRKVRDRLLGEVEWDFVAWLGPKGFQTPMWDFNIILVGLTRKPAMTSQQFAALDVSDAATPSEKAAQLELNDLRLLSQEKQSANPDRRVLFAETSEVGALAEYADSFKGLATGDLSRFIFSFWELPVVANGWRCLQGSVSATTPYGGRDQIILWEDGRGALFNYVAERLGPSGTGAWLRGGPAWGRQGIAVAQISSLTAAVFSGDLFDENTAAIIPKNPAHLKAVWAYCSSPQFPEEVRKLDDSMKVPTLTLLKVPFDLAHWQTVAAKEYPNGLPEPESDDPTQWLFHGRPEQSTAPLQVAVARLLGYRWPAELEGPHPNPLPEGEGTGMRLSTRARELVQTCDALLPLADKDGIVCIPSVRGEPPAGERVLEVLHAAYGSKWSNSVLHDLLTEAGCKPGTTLDDWLRNALFEQHCKLFHSRPFIWHIWDGHKDGFSCLVNYHKLGYKTLENLTHSYLRDWIAVQAAAAKEGKTGADLRLAAAQGLQKKLELILQGEEPCDIFVRWKPIEEQPIGWHPDLNDGVRMNIRPFVTAGVLRKNPNIKWTKDRGKDPETAPWFKVFKGERINDYHLTLTEKQAATAKAGGKK